jgi:hypothetical protein
MNQEDNEMFDKLFSDKARYTLVFDNDAVFLQDNMLDSENDERWECFSEYGYEFAKTFADYLGLQTDYV